MERNLFVKESAILFGLSALFLIILSFMTAPTKLFLAMILVLCLSASVLFIYLLNKISRWIAPKINSEFMKQILKFFIYLIPSVIFIYIIYMNVAPYIAGGNMNFFVDIGSKEEANAKGITGLTPSSRVGDKVDVSYRDIKSPLVYFDAHIPNNAEKIKVGVRFKDDFPENAQGFYIGAKDREDWHYTYIPLYLPGFYKLENLTYITDNTTRLYMLGEAGQFSTISTFMDNIPKNSVIATDMDLEQKEVKLDNYETGETVVTNAIRGSATMYTYAKYSLNVSVEKFDINWYEGEDPLTINVYNSKNELVGNATINDDGFIGKDAKEIGKPQQGNLHIYPLEGGVYKIQLKGTSDTVITKIRVNQQKLVFEGNILLADNEQYNLTKKPATIYLKNNRKNYIIFATWHKEGLQNITVNKKRIDINKAQQQFNYNIEPSDNFYEIKTTKNDLVINTINYLSFSKDSYFEPFEYKVIGLNNFDFIKDNADYILTDYKEPKNENGWLTNYAEFDPKDLFIKDNKLNMVLNAKHLGDPNYADYYIPVDWIKVDIETKGIFS